MGVLTAIGLMSGTSMDGIDIALIESDGETALSRGPFASLAYDEQTRRLLLRALEEARAITDRSERPGALGEAEARITALHARVVVEFARDHGIELSRVDIVGFHGQTVLHRPENGLTVQLGDGQMLADGTGLAVISDFRAADMEAGGQGAPLAPAYHRALAGRLPQSFERPVAFVNVGGISNITGIGSDGGLIAFDTGPGNNLLDQWVEARTGRMFDRDGGIAASGTVLEPLARSILANLYFELPPPKSLDRADFVVPANDAGNVEDVARTLAHVTARSILAAADHLPQRPKTWIVCGGGRHHPVIMADLADLAAGQGAMVASAEQAGFDGDAVEAEAFAYLAIRSMKSLPLTYPGTTGCAQPTPGGVLARSARRAAVG